MKSTNKKGFTLVELIIVITILAILATIAFVSFQSYSADARDTKRKSNINDIVKSIELKSTQWVSLLNFASGVTTSQLLAWKIAWTWVTLDKDYQAWDVNLTTLGLGTEFKDGTNSYKIWVTTKAWGAYQVAWKMEANSLAFVKWTFNPRTSTWYWIGYFKLQDTLSWGTVVTKISADLATLNDSVKAASGTTVLAQDDVAWLINSVTSSWTAVTDGWANLPY